MIAVKDLTFIYGKHTPIFENYSWRAARGDTWAIIGPSGCGKTTLLYLLAGLKQPHSGSVLVDGAPVNRPRPETGLILQDHGLLPWSTVWDNARLGHSIREFYGPDGSHAPSEAWLDKAAIEERTGAWLKRLGIYEQRDKFPAQLSGGQRQRTAIARTLSLSPDVLLMDEPFSALDAPTREDLQNLTFNLSHEENLTTVLVTHNIEEAVFMGQRILVLGEPPNKTPYVIENPQAGQPDFRRQATFLSMTGQIRATLGMQHEAAH